ncbi:MAG: FtsX-like permease family protein [Candidatus Hydrogenedentes bacterium]|nr:FtsX-like permease family protein [Candidatus Hydrogenedentota bacterium]
MERVTVARLILREIQRAKLNTVLCAATVLLAVGVLVAMVSLTRASVDATRVMMKQLGFNVLITPPGVDPGRYQALDFQDADMPEDYVDRLAESTALAQHFVGKYQKTLLIDGCTAVLTGVRPELPKLGTRMAPMPTAYVVPEGRVFLGFAVARALQKGPGDSLAVLGRAFTVDKVLDEAGMIPDDIRIFANLHDVQALVNRPGRINAIDALSCYCPVDVDDIMGALEDSIRRALPDVNVKPYTAILKARNEQRRMMYRLEVAAILIVVVGSATAIWGLTYQNVRNRRREIGVLRALGVADWRIAMLFIGKILAYGIVGAVAGCALGWAAAALLNTTGRPVTPSANMLIGLVLAAPAASILFGLPPVFTGLLQEPTEALRDTAA